MVYQSPKFCWYHQGALWRLTCWIYCSIHRAAAAESFGWSRTACGNAPGWCKQIADFTTNVTQKCLRRRKYSTYYEQIHKKTVWWWCAVAKPPKGMHSNIAKGVKAHSLLSKLARGCSKREKASMLARSGWVEERVDTNRHGSWQGLINSTLFQVWFGNANGELVKLVKRKKNTTLEGKIESWNLE